jgi:hypothetical protein
MAAKTASGFLPPPAGLPGPLQQAAGHARRARLRTERGDGQVTQAGRRPHCEPGGDPLGHLQEPIL